MTDYSTIMWNYLIHLDLFNLFVTALNYYFPFGSFFWILGFVIFIVVQLKTKSFTYACIPLSLYFVILGSIDGLVINAYSRMSMTYVGLLLTAVSGLAIYNMIKGK